LAKLGTDEALTFRAALHRLSLKNRESMPGMSPQENKLAAAWRATWPAFGLAGLGLLAASPASAMPPTTVTVGAYDAGNYCRFSIVLNPDPCSPPHVPSDTEYRVGYIDYITGAGEVDLTYRGFFVFNLNNPQIQSAFDAGEQVVAATLRAVNGTIKCGASTTICSPEQVINLHGVQGSIANLINGTLTFNDLGQGPSFGFTTFPAVLPPNTQSSYSLNASGLMAVNSALLADLALSTRHDKEVGGVTESPIYVYGDTTNLPNNPNVFLDLTFGPKAPAVPSPLPLFGAGAAFRVSRRLRRRTRQPR
jgi:hypothetical protein